MDRFLDTYHLPKNNKLTENLNTLKTTTEIKSVIESLPITKSPGPTCWILPTGEKAARWGVHLFSWRKERPPSKTNVPRQDTRFSATAYACNVMTLSVRGRWNCNCSCRTYAIVHQWGKQGWRAEGKRGGRGVTGNCSIPTKMCNKNE